MKNFLITISLLPFMVFVATPLLLLFGSVSTFNLTLEPQSSITTLLLAFLSTMLTVCGAAFIVLIQQFLNQKWRMLLCVYMFLPFFISHDNIAKAFSIFFSSADTSQMIFIVCTQVYSTIAFAYCIVHMMRQVKDQAEFLLLSQHSGKNITQFIFRFQKLTWPRIRWAYATAFVFTFLYILIQH